MVPDAKTAGGGGGSTAALPRPAPRSGPRLFRGGVAGKPVRAPSPIPGPAPGLSSRMIVLVGGCIVSALCFIPLSAVAFGAGAAFGLAAVPAVVTAATAGACIAFLIARGLAGPAAVRLIRRSRTAGAVLQAVEDESWRVLGLIRLSSPIPFSLANYVYGLTRMPLAVFAATTLVGICPAVTFYAYLGFVGGAVLREEAVSVERLVLLGIGGAMLVAVAVIVGRRTREILKGVPAA